jgi:single-strand DNA-binding protein
MLNHITIMGRMTAKPELKTTPGGKFVTTFTLAVDRDFKDKETGERATDFINCVAWRGTAEFVTRFFDKGRVAVVDGRLQIREYTDKDGNNRRVAEVVADTVYFGDSNNSGAGNDNAGQQTAYTPSEPKYEELKDDEELPF